MSAAPNTEFTEEEQGRYDRQIRLWGIEAQQRMRKATILVVKLGGTATEAIKNIVLAGVGKLIIVDDEEVSEEDLGAGFFFRDEDVGKKRTEAAKARIESLNPLVLVETRTLEAIGDSIAEADVTCFIDSSRQDLLQFNEACRVSHKKFYAGGTFGLLGYVFCDLLDHEYTQPSKGAPQDGERELVVSKHPSLQSALEYHWSSLSRRQTKELNPSAVFAILAIWEYQSIHQGALPNSGDAAAELESIAERLMAKAEVNKQGLTTPIQDFTLSLSTTASHEFSPVCAVVGGMLAQDILKTLAGRDPPLSNFFAFDGHTGAGTVCRMNMA